MSYAINFIIFNKLNILSQLFYFLKTLKNVV